MSCEEKGILSHSTLLPPFPFQPKRLEQQSLGELSQRAAKRFPVAALPQEPGSSHRGTVPLHSAGQSPVETGCSCWEMEASVIQGGTVSQDTASC